MIEPRYDKDGITLYCADCLEILPMMAAESMDAVITDPPYGKKPIGHFGQKDAIRFDKDDFQWDKKPSKYIFDEIFRISKNQIIWGANYFIDYLKPTNCILVWDKKNGNNPYSDIEIAWTSFTGASKIYRMFWLGSHIHRIEKIYHPTQKPLDLMKWVIDNFTNSNDIIFDSFMGSGTTGVAARQLGRRFVGIEINEKYYQIAEKRIQEAQMQLRLPF